MYSCSELTERSSTGSFIVDFFWLVSHETRGLVRLLLLLNFLLKVSLASCGLIGGPGMLTLCLLRAAGHALVESGSLARAWTPDVPRQLLPSRQLWRFRHARRFPTSTSSC